jgi:FHA domain-containing protein
MSARCPDGHESESTDYCDVCGLPMSAAPASGLDLGPPPTVAMPVDASGSANATDKPCPNCAALVPVDDLFCEVCGYDFTTGALPDPVTHPGGIALPGGDAGQAAVTPAPGGGGAAGGASPAGTPPHTEIQVPSVAVVWVAEVWVDPDWFATQESEESCPSAGMPVVAPLRENSVLVGRRSTGRNIHPQVDCGADHGVSRRHAQLTTDGQRWWVEDLQSSNGTFVGQAGAPIPMAPVPPGQRVEFSPGDRIYVGAWTRIVVRKATADEQ